MNADSRALMMQALSPAGFGQRLRLLRADQTRASVAGKAGINSHQWANWENGTNEPKLKTLQKIVLALELNAREVMWLVMGK